MLFSFPTTSSSSAKTFVLHSSSAYLQLLRKAKSPYTFLNCLSSSTSPSKSSTPNQNPEPHQTTLLANHAGLRFEETVGPISQKLRLDYWISSRISGVSRARIQSSIRSGLVSVNGKTISKVSSIIKRGDKVNCTIAELQPLRAEPEDIPVHVVFEDDHLLVVNKPAHMVVHPAPGNANGTLVNAILHHCRLPSVAFPSSDRYSEADDGSDDELDMFSADRDSDEEISFRVAGGSIRPGIVHRLDKGTSGLLVVAKDDHSHACLAEQFKLHTIHRVYVSLTSGVPPLSQGYIEIPIGRDPNNRVRMIAVSGSSNCKWARHAASRYRVIEVLAAGGSALVEWRLETGRTHQIRAHAKHLGVPLLGDEVYGGTKDMALSLLRPKTPSSYHSHLSDLVSKLDRPCLHALSLGFKHPHTGKDVQFTYPPPPDFSEVLSQLRSISTEKVFLARHTA